MNKIIQKLKNEYQGKKVLVVGLGLQGGGSGVAEFFAKLGAQVTVTDKKSKEQLQSSIDLLKDYPIKYHFGEHPVSLFTESDLIFKGPFVPWNIPGIIEAEKKGIPIEMELSFFAKMCPAKIIGITGTRGKSTTTHMIYAMMKEFGMPVFLAGSLPGISTISYLDTVTNKDWIVMELPSWPLADFYRKKISPHIAVFTNLYPDHLNFYKSMNDYAFDKKAIYLNQNEDDHLVINRALKDIVEHDYVKSHVHYFEYKDWQYEFEYLQGNHNRENASSALQVGKILGFNQQKSIRFLSAFKGLPYRQQKIGVKNGVIFVNDTTSTTPVATSVAINTFVKDSKKIYLILGGNAKKLPHEILIDNLVKTEKIILLKGSLTDELMPILQTRFSDKITDVYDSIEHAVRKAYELTLSTGGLVLFSPGATSFAMFHNEFHRGDEFNRVVQLIINS